MHGFIYSAQAHEEWLATMAAAVNNNSSSITMTATINHTISLTADNGLVGVFVFFVELNTDTKGEYPNKAL